MVVYLPHIHLVCVNMKLINKELDEDRALLEARYMEENTQLELGEKIREKRKQLGITINEISNRTNLTSSFISQFERGRTKASMTSIIKIVESMGLTMSSLFEEQQITQIITPNTRTNNTVITEIPYLVRKGDRPKLSYPVTPNDVMFDYLLTHPTNNLQVYISELHPMDSCIEKYVQNGTEEFILILEGRFEIQIEENNYILNPGDSLTFNCKLSRTWKNISDSVTKILWIVYK